MIDLYLKAATEADMNAALVNAGLATESDEGLIPADGVELDVIGAIPDVDGWHVNAKGAALTEEVRELLVAVAIEPPKTPYRVWM